MIISELYCDECGCGDFEEITRMTKSKPPHYWKPEEEIIYKCKKCGCCYKIAGADTWKVEC